MKFKLIEEFYKIEQDDIDHLGADLFVLFENLFRWIDFKNDYNIKIEDIPNNADILRAFENYSGLGEQLIDLLKNNLAELPIEAQDINYQKLISGALEICNKYANDFLKGNIEV